MSTIVVTTGPCVVCGKTNEVVCSAEGYAAWKRDTHIQDALPELSDGEREMLISGTCSDCFDKLFPPDED